VLCLRKSLFGILFHARAFQNLNFALKIQLHKLFMSKDCKQLLVPLGQDKDNWYLFCKTELVKRGSDYSLDPADVKDSNVKHIGHFWGDPRLEGGVSCASFLLWKQ